MPGTNGYRPLIGVPLTHDHNQRGAEIYGLRRTYFDALELAGAAPYGIPLDKEADVYRSLFARLDGLFLAGGEDIHPAAYGQAPHALLGTTDAERDRVEILLTRLAVDEGKPVFGVCRGHQVLSVALGGTMYQDVQTMAPEVERHDYRDKRFSRQFLSHTVSVDPDSWLARTVGEQPQVNSLHHQAIDRPGAGLEVIGRTEGGVIEAVEMPGHPFVVGVQWHPEELVADAKMLDLFKAFVRACRGHYLPVSTPATIYDGQWQ